MSANSTLKSAIVPSSQPAIYIPDGPALSYSQLTDQISHLQPLFESLPAQSPVSISLTNSLEFTTTFLAITFSRNIAAPLNPNYKKSESDFYIDDLKSKVVVVSRGSFSKNTEIVQSAKEFNTAVVEVWYDPNTSFIEYEIFNYPSSFQLKSPATDAIGTRSPLPDDVALVLHTSGTTGRPKAVPLTHLNISTTVKNIINTYRLRSDDRSYLVMPLFHVHGLICGLLGPLGSGGSVIIPSRFSPKFFWDHFIKYNANWYTAVPTIHHILLSSPKPVPLPHIRFIRSCSSALAPSVFHKLENEFNAPVLEAYAMTEAAHQMTSNNLPPGQRKPGTVGVGQGVEIVILDENDNILPNGKEGEISIKGINVTKGYINNVKANKESFTSNGYFRTGDQGKKDPDGFLIITGRIKELINRGGEKISPIELDGILLQHPKVSEAVVFAAEDEKYGQVVNAAIVIKKNEKITEDEIKKFMSEKVSSYKIPVRVFFTDIMPKTATGKVQRRIIAKTFLEKDSKSKL